MTDWIARKARAVLDLHKEKGTSTADAIELLCKNTSLANKIKIADAATLLWVRDLAAMHPAKQKKKKARKV